MTTDNLKTTTDDVEIQETELLTHNTDECILHGCCQEDADDDVDSSLVDVFESASPPTVEHLPFRPIMVESSRTTTATTSTSSISTTDVKATTDSSKYDADDEIDTTQSDGTDDFCSSLWSSQELQEIGEWVENQLSSDPGTDFGGLNKRDQFSTSTTSSSNQGDDSSSSSTLRSSSGSVLKNYTKPWDVDVQYTWYMVVQPESFYLKVNGEGSCFLVLESADEILDTVRCLVEDHHHTSSEGEELNFLIWWPAQVGCYMLVAHTNIVNVLKDIIRCKSVVSSSSLSSMQQQQKTFNNNTSSSSSRFQSISNNRSYKHIHHGGQAATTNHHRRKSSSGVKLHLHLRLGSAWRSLMSHRRRRVSNSYRSKKKTANRLNEKLGKW
jgi:hypothetical protein